jgi:hypothetical protein
MSCRSPARHLAFGRTSLESLTRQVVATSQKGRVVFDCRAARGAFIGHAQLGARTVGTVVLIHCPALRRGGFIDDDHEVVLAVCLVDKFDPI